MEDVDDRRGDIDQALGRAAQITDMSDESMSEKFGRKTKNVKKPFKFSPEFEVEGYPHHRGHSFIHRLGRSAARTQIFFRGKTPVTPSLPYAWHNTPNLHFLSILDFVEYCRARGIVIEDAKFLGLRKKVTLFPNLFARTGIFVLRKTEEATA